MPLKSFDSKDAIPEALRETAIESKDGKFVIAEDPDVSGIQSALEKERKRAGDEEKARKELERRTSELEQQIKGSAAGLTEQQQKEFRDSVRKDLEKEFEPLKDKASKYDSLERRVLLDDPVKDTMLSKEVGVRGERQKALWTLIKDRFDLTADGKPMVKDHPGVSIDKYLGDVVKREYPEFFVGTQATGGGAGGSNSGAPPANTKPPTQWSSAERAEYIRTNGIEAYNDLLKAQIRDGVTKKSA